MENSSNIYYVDYAEQFKKSFLRKNSNSASNLNYRFFYNKDGEGCLEFTVTPKPGYHWNEPKWIGYIWGNYTGNIGYNKIIYTLTRKKADEAQSRMEDRRKEKAFCEIEKIVFKIACEYDYDYESAYGVRVKYRNPKIKKAVCDGYSDAVSEAFKNHPLVKKTEKWSSSIGNHAWNVIVLKDSRKLYCDVTWYDGSNIDEEGYLISAPEKNPVNLTFDIEEFNSLGGAINKATGRLLAVHFAWKDARLV